MSWGMQGTVSGGEINVDTVNGIDTQPHKDQFETAKVLIAATVASGAVGAPDGNFKFTVSGHGNEGHVPAPGWANDFISLNVSQVV